ncbi:MAG: hypothetical protein ACPL28_09900 [bacterium]
MVSLLKPFGIVSYVLILFAVLTGLRVIKLDIRWHRLIALFGIITATIHLAIVIYLNYF